MMHKTSIAFAVAMASLASMPSWGQTSTVSPSLERSYFGSSTLKPGGKSGESIDTWINGDLKKFSTPSSSTNSKIAEYAAEALKKSSIDSRELIFSRISESALPKYSTALQDRPIYKFGEIDFGIDANSNRQLTPEEKRRMYESRGQGDLTESKGFNKIDPKMREAKAGSSAQVTSCNSVLKRLRSASKTNSAFDLGTMGDIDIRNEQDYEKECLSIPDERFSPSIPPLNVGRLHKKDGQVLCTATLIDSETAITARHCLFKTSEPAENISLSLFPDVSDWYIETGALGNGRRSKIAAVELRNSTGEWMRHEVNAQGFGVTVIGRKAVTADMARVKLKTPLPEISSIAMERSAPSVGDRLYLFGFYPGYQLAQKANDSGIRYQKAGYCQVLKVSKDGCILHGCATNQSASGAPIFIQSSGGEYRFVGIHIAANDATENVCGTDMTFGATANVAIPF